MYLLFFICSFFVARALAWYEQPYALEQAELNFAAFIQEHNKNYTDEHEKQARFQIFKDNLARAIRMNEELGDHVFGITQFMDLTLEEFTNLYTGSNKLALRNFESICKDFYDEDILDTDAPESLDWRELGVVTSVKNQVKCKGCYAFSAAANVESQYAKKYKLLDLSPQQIIDCDHGSSGCDDGGHLLSSFGTLIEEGGLMAEVDYPFTGVTGSCQFDETKIKAKVIDCNAYHLKSQEKVKQLLNQNGPLSVSVRSDTLRIYDSRGSIIPDKACQGTINHDVLLVGYGTENGNPYWIMKNSWSESWGDKGYFRLQRGEGADSCGMMSDMLSTSVVA